MPNKDHKALFNKKSATIISLIKNHSIEHKKSIETKKSMERASIQDALRDLVSFVQFKKQEKHPWRSVTISKIAGQHHILK